MSEKLHPLTQAKVNQYARKYLAIYRAIREAGAPPSTARNRANMALCTTLSGNVFAVVQNRQAHYRQAYRLTRSAVLSGNR